MSRSPSYPHYSLEDAIENVNKIFSADRTNPIDREVAAKHMGYSGKNGAADRSLSTLMRYGLLEKSAKGEVRVSQTALDILVPENQNQKIEALFNAAYAPTLFKTLYERFSEGAPSQNALKAFLTRERYTDRAVESITTAYLKTCNLLEREDVYKNNIIDKQKHIELEPSPNVDLVSNESPKQETPNFLPKTQFLSVTEPSTQEHSNSVPQEVEWMRNKVGPNSTIRIIATGEMGPKEIGKLIKLLEAQKMVLEDD